MVVVYKTTFHQSPPTREKELMSCNLPEFPDFDETDANFKEKLLVAAEGALELAYSPYSKGKVGAALLGASGRIYLGANIGNMCSTLNCCAEQAAIVQGALVRDFPFRAIAVVQNSSLACPPCGRCLQLLAEFSLDIPVITRSDGKLIDWRLNFLLPIRFRRAPDT
jgi:cytidine deaminase